jgi:23S rRNA pseudouridine2605 synthase
MSHANDPNAAAGLGQAAGERKDSEREDDDDGAAGERVAKVLARAGVASRREVERLIAAGRVRLNGVALDTPAIRVGPRDNLSVDGRSVAAREATRVWRYHKPAGLLTSHRDPRGRPTVFEHLPPDLPRVISIGRLDLNSEGLLLLTNDGELARALELPATGVVRRYRARARGRTTQDQLDQLKAGITIEGVHYGSIDARLEEPSGGGVNRWITVTLSEGKNREVRKVLEALDLTVNRLIRLDYGPFDLGNLKPGEVVEVSPRVIGERLGGLLSAGRPPTEAEFRPRPAASAKVAAPTAPKPKAEYKAGWARPKSKVKSAPKPKLSRKAVKTGLRGSPEAAVTATASPRPKRKPTARRPGPFEADGPKPRE